MIKGKKRVKGIWGAIILAVTLAGCATVQPTWTVQVGEFTVRLYADRQRLEADIEKISIFIPALQGLGLGFSGFYDRRTKTIYAIDDPLIILHELKHALDPGWSHAAICGPDRCLERGGQ